MDYAESLAHHRALVDRLLAGDDEAEGFRPGEAAWDIVVSAAAAADDEAMVRLVGLDFSVPRWTFWRSRFEANARGGDRAAKEGLRLMKQYDGRIAERF